MQGDRARLGFVGDVHWTPEPAPEAAWHNPYDFGGVPGRLGAALAHFERAGVDLVVVGGDLTHRGDRASVRAVLDACAAAPAPVVAVAGNHDAPAPLEHDRAQRLGPRGMDVAGLRVAGVGLEDGGGWFGTRMGDAPCVAELGDGAAVVVSHFPLVSRAELVAGHGFPYPGDLLGRDRIVEELSERRAPTVVLSGHIHARDSVARGPLLQLTHGALIEPPYECSIVDVTREPSGAVTVRRASHRLAPSHVRREPVFVAPSEEWRFQDGAWTSHAAQRGEAS